MSLKGATLRFSLELALLELVIWLGLGVFLSSSAENLYAALLTYSAEHFSEIAVAIATTFYVVFTYRLLENSETQRKHATEPYLMVRWYQCAERTGTQLNHMGQLAEKARSWLIEAFAFDPTTTGEASMATRDRYLILGLSNVRKTPVGWIRLAVKGTLEISGSRTARFWEELHLKDLQIGDGEKVEVTMADLFPIPQGAKVTLAIEAMTYGAIDGGGVVNESSGDHEKSAPGEFMLTESKGPQPH